MLERTKRTGASPKSFSGLLYDILAALHESKYVDDFSKLMKAGTFEREEGDGSGEFSV
jgi:hypothetical protein